jgi:hypothetical protein
MKLLFSLSICLTFVSVYSQKVDIDNHKVTFHYANLPEYYVPETKRKISISTTGTNAVNVLNLPQSLRLYGWDVVSNKNDASIDIKLLVRGMSFGQAQNNSRKEEKKDDKGNVVSTTTYYKVSTTNEGRADYNIYGVADSYKEMVKNKKEEIKKKDDKKEQQKKQEEANNPFLNKVNKKVSETSSGVKPVLFQNNMNQTFNYTTNEYTSSEAASKEYNNNANRETRNHESRYLDELPNRFEDLLNRTFGFAPVRQNVSFKKLDSDKHPEYTMFKNATDAIKIIVQKMRYNQPIDEVVSDIEPLVEYFLSLSNRLKRSNDKNDKKLRGAALYNYALLKYVTDEHEDCIIACNDLIASDIEKGDAKDLKNNAEQIARKLVFFNMKTRHIVPLTDLDRKDDVGREIVP